MLVIFFVLMIGMMIVFGAGRIILGWILPVSAMRRIDAAVSGFFTLVFKLCVVALAGLILYGIWAISTHPS